MGAEMPPQKASALLAAVRNSPNPCLALLNSPLLNPTERARVQKVDSRLLAELAARGVTVIRKEELPEHYRAVPQAPVGLFCWGDGACLREPSIAIVGTRAATTYGKAVAQKFA